MRRRLKASGWLTFLLLLASGCATNAAGSGDAGAGSPTRDAGADGGSPDPDASTDASSDDADAGADGGSPDPDASTDASSDAADSSAADARAADPDAAFSADSSEAGADAGCVPDLACVLEAVPSTGDPYQDCVDRINQFRALCACLPPLERWTDGEACADEMAAYDAEREEAHAGRWAGICEGGRAQNECPGWGPNDIPECLQMMWSEGPPPPEPCDGPCDEGHGHFINMTNIYRTRVACGFATTSDGLVWSVQNFM